MNDTISRLAVIQIIEKMRARIGHNLERSIGRAMIEILDEVGKDVEKLPSAQPEVKQISYTDCANAMLMMWMDKVLTDGEYNRIMDKLNEHEKKKGKDNG